LTIATVRALIPDRARFARDTFVADGRSDYQAANRPLVAASVKVYLAGALQADGYTVDLELGLVTFAAAPPASIQIVVTYQHTLLSDDTLSVYLALEGDDRHAAADALDAIASDHALVEKAIRLGDLQTNGPAVSASLRAHAKALREQASALGADGAGFDIADMVHDDFGYAERLIKQAQREG
jgi:hypothetical protein